MSNFFRAVRVTFRYRLSIIAAVVCALMVSVLWGGSIGAVAYPVVEICLKKGTFTDWLDANIESSEKRITELKAASKPDHRAIADEKTWLARYHWARPLAEQYTPRSPFWTVLFIMSIGLLGTIVKIGFLIAHGILSATIAQYGAAEIREQFFRKVLDYEVNHFSREGIADTMSRFTNDMGILTHGLTIIYGKIVREPLKMVACLALAAYLSWQLLLLTLLVVPLAIVSIRWLARSIKRVVRRGMEEMSVMYGRLEETFRSVRVVKAFTRESLERAKFRKTNRAYCQKAIKIAKYESLTNPLTEFCGILMVCIALVVGAYLVMGERTTLLGISMAGTPLSIASLTTFFVLLAGAADPARKLSDIFTAFQSAAAAADRVYALIDREVPIRDVENPKRLSKHEKSIRFDNIRFAYDPTRPVLNGVSLDINFGECVAILGPSGCGKSTLLNLIPRFADPTSGQVLIDDLPLTEIRMRDVRHQIGLVTQEPVLFNDTVMNNILYGSRSATPERAVEAAKKAFAHDFIENELREGYETVVGPGGGQLSGGQRQRIALARAILREPSIFLLDEATSQIDLNSEKMIHAALETFKHGRTTIMVTHRLSALSLADRIVVMQNGEIAAVGRHEELLDSCPFYAKLYQD